MTRVLIVDGDASNLYLLESLLRAQGWAVVAAKDGVEALTLGRAQPPDLVVSEVGMLGMNGFDLCREWMKDGVLRTVPFVFYSENHTRTSDAERGLSLGAAAYVKRPEDPARLVLRLKTALETAAEATANAAAASAANAAAPVADGAAEDGQAVRKTPGSPSGIQRGLTRRAESWEAKCRRLEAELEERRRVESVQQLKAELVDLVPDAVVLLDFEGTVHFWNVRAAELYGWSVNEAVGARFSELVGLDAAAVASVIHAVGQRGEWAGEMDLHTPSRRAIAVGFRWTLLRGDAFRPRGILVVGVDVSDRRRLETQVLRAQRLETFASLASGVAHEINNTLTPLMMTVPLLRADMPPADLEKAASVVHSGIRRVASAIRPLMGLGFGAGGERASVSVRAVVQSVQAWMERAFPKVYEVSVNMPENLWSVVGDAGQLELSLKGFCAESRDAMPAGGRIVLTAENVTLGLDDLTAQPDVGPGPFVRIRVEDNSSGVPPRKPAAPVENRDGTTPGTVCVVVLGTAVARRHGGFLEARAEPGQGSSVVLALPALVDPQAGNGEAAPTAGGPFGNGELLLVVDDEVAVREFSRRTLERYGYQVLLAGDGAEGLVQYSRHRAAVKLVISDITMPVLDGVMFARALRRMDRELPLLIWSGLDERGRRTELQSFGVNQFLLKPLAAPDFLSAIAQALATRSSPPA